MKNVLRLMFLVVLLGTVSLNSITAFAFDLKDKSIVESSVKINDQYLISDTSHILVDDSVFVVGRYLVESLGGVISWNEERQTVVMILEDKNIEIMIDSVEGTINGEQIALYKAPFIKDGRTMIPLRFVSEYFGCDVSWIQETYTVNILKDGLEIPKDYVYNRPYTDEDLYLLSKIVTVESGDVSLEMALAIANTVLNRVKDNRFPDTIDGVIYHVDVHKQFPTAHKESFKTLKSKPLSIIAAKKALEGVNNIGESLFFNNRPFNSKSDDLIKVIDGEYFYK